MQRPLCEAWFLSSVLFAFCVQLCLDNHECNCSLSNLQCDSHTGGRMQMPAVMCLLPTADAWCLPVGGRLKMGRGGRGTGSMCPQWSQAGLEAQDVGSSRAYAHPQWSLQVCPLLHAAKARNVVLQRHTTHTCLSPPGPPAEPSAGSDGTQSSEHSPDWTCSVASDSFQAYPGPAASVMINEHFPGHFCCTPQGHHCPY